MRIRNFLPAISPAFLLCITLTTTGFHSLAQTNDKIDGVEKIRQIQHTYGLDPATALPNRIKETPADVIKMFKEAGMSPTQHQLSMAERVQVEKAFAALPPLHQRVLKEHLRSISFLDHMPNTALTSVVNTNDAYRLYDITFRAEILHQNVSEWLTEKERGCFGDKGSHLSVSIAAGTIDAVVYILMHEATHVVDGSLGLLADNLHTKKLADTVKSTFVTNVWTDRTVFVPQYRNTILDSTRYTTQGRILPIDSARDIYLALERTPFVSLYSTSSQHEDIAEYFTVYHFTQKLKQPFEIIIRDHGKTVLVFEPMKSKLTKSRMRYMRIFYHETVPV
eukprot:gene865-870_t